jgi:hypothetical protein
MDTDDFVYIAGSDSSGFAFSLLDDEGETKAKYLNKTFIYFAGGRSYENPNAATLPAAAFKLMDEQFVNSTRTARVHVNIESGVAELEDVEVLTVYTAAAEATATNPEVLESYSVRFACNAPPAGVSAEVVVYYEADGISKDNSKTYQLAKDKSGKFSYSLDPNQLRMDLGLSADKFMAATLKCLFTASKEYSQSPSVSDLRRSIPVSVNYTPKMKPSHPVIQVLVKSPVITNTTSFFVSTKEKMVKHVAHFKVRKLPLTIAKPASKSWGCRVPARFA